MSKCTHRDLFTYFTGELVRLEWLEAVIDWEGSDHMNWSGEIGRKKVVEEVMRD